MLQEKINSSFDTHPKWNNKEFCAFLLLYSALADKIITAEEKAMVLANVDEKIYDDILKEIKSNTDDVNRKILLSYQGLYFPTLAQKKELLHMVKKEFYADMDFSEVEMELYETLKTIM